VRFQLRDFRNQDFDTLWKIDQKCFPPGISYSQTELKFYIRHRGSFTLVAEAEAGESIFGFIVAEVARGRVGHIITIDVLSDARRLGVGSKLLHTAETRLAEGGCERVMLETAVDNTSALAFYKRHGYFLVKTVPHYYSNGVDAFVLEKSLTSSP
jgi:ribosomal-protein-alanine N-acetyltransferase